MYNLGLCLVLCIMALQAPGTLQQQGCSFPKSDIYFLVDVSSNVESQTRGQYSKDFKRLKEGLTSFVNSLQNGGSTGLRTGLISYSDTARTVNLPSVYNSVGATLDGIKNIPNTVAQGGANPYNALRSITSYPASGSQGYVVIITANTNGFGSNQNVLRQYIDEAKRVKNLGYKVIVMPVHNMRGGSGRYPTLDLYQLSSGTNYNIDVDYYQGLYQGLVKFRTTILCGIGGGGGSSYEDGICPKTSNTGNQQRIFVAHPVGCDHYFQCYYKTGGAFDLAIIRQCPEGLFWNSRLAQCTIPSQAACKYDPCQQSGLRDYSINSNCKGYYQCYSGHSMAKCCGQGQSYITKRGGCVQDNTCNVVCNYASLAAQQGGCPNTGCSFGYTKDKLTCKCIQGYVNQCQPNNIGSPTGSLLRNQFSIQLKYKEATAVTVKTPLASNEKVCGNAGTPIGSLDIDIGNYYIIATFTANDGRIEGEMHLPTKGMSANEIKEITLNYDQRQVTFSLKGKNHQYIDSFYLAHEYNFPCGMKTHYIQGVTTYPMNVRNCLVPNLYDTSVN